MGKFNYAGDHLLKEIIQQVIIEGSIKNEEYRGCSGVIRNHIIDNELGSPGELLNTFFGENNNRINFLGKKMRKDFNIQIAKPIAEKFLQLTQEKSDNQELSFEDFFPNSDNQPQERLLNYFERHFGFRFEDLDWKFSLERINEIIETVFEPLLKKLSTLLFSHGCDFVLISGRPTSLYKVEELFHKLYPVPPNRLVSLNNYRVGQWYPFQDGNGYFNDQKSIVAVGGMIALLGGKLDRLNDFGLNMESLKEDLVSTASYFGIYNKDTRQIINPFLSPKVNNAKVEFSGLPVALGVKRLESPSYPSRAMYEIDFNDDKIKENIKRRKKVIDESHLNEEVNKYRENLKKYMPFTFKIRREFRKSRENIFIESVINSNREELSPKLFNLRFKTMSNESGHWLDNGAFLLGIDY